MEIEKRMKVDWRPKWPNWQPDYSAILSRMPTVSSLEFDFQSQPIDLDLKYKFVIFNSSSFLIKKNNKWTYRLEFRNRL